MKMSTFMGWCVPLLNHYTLSTTASLVISQSLSFISLPFSVSLLHGVVGWGRKGAHVLMKYPAQHPQLHNETTIWLVYRIFHVSFGECCRHVVHPFYSLPLRASEGLSPQELFSRFSFLPSLQQHIPGSRVGRFLWHVRERKQKKTSSGAGWHFWHTWFCIFQGGGLGFCWWG